MQQTLAHTIEELSNPLEKNDFSQFLDEIPSQSETDKWLQNQKLSADAKAWMKKVLDVTVLVGSTVIPIGRKILSTVYKVVRAFPGTTFGLLVGTVLSLLIGGIPLIGAVLGPILSPLLLAFGLGMGAISDFMAGSFRELISSIEDEYSILMA